MSISCDHCGQWKLTILSIPNLCQEGDVISVVNSVLCVRPGANCQEIQHLVVSLEMKANSEIDT